MTTSTGVEFRPVSMSTVSDDQVGLESGETDFHPPGSDQFSPKSDPFWELEECAQRPCHSDVYLVTLEVPRW